MLSTKTSRQALPPANIVSFESFRLRQDFDLPSPVHTKGLRLVFLTLHHTRNKYVSRKKVAQRIRADGFELVPPRLAFWR
jgi:hypothetical protein